ncbi:MAG: DUF3040 domain-containing protein [Symploca sp. SIO2E9]|nr:DUF3040 domain-containing protein [Symploca sp. SIO2E9]
MNSQDDKHKDLQRRERELQEREHSIRLREIEAELYKQQPPLHQTVPLQKPQKSEGWLKRWQKRMVRLGKFAALIVVVVISYKVAVQLAGVIIVGTIAFVSYKLFIESDKSDQ